MAGCAGFLSGNSVQQATIQITPSNLNFGNVALGHKVSQSLSVKNTGTATINVTAATLTSPQFTISGVNFPLSLAAGSTANLSVSFSGSTKGGVNGILVLKTDTGSISAPVNLSATATVAGAQLTPAPSTLSFGAVTIGTSASSPVTLTNTGSSDLKISVITVNGAPFGVSGITTPTTISAGQAAILNVIYSPTSTSNDSGSISITSNDPASPTTIGLSGNGTTAPVGRLSLNPTSLSFGNVTVGKSSTLSSTLTNTGQATVHISGVSAPGSGFTASGVSAGTAVAAGQSYAIQVRFAPATAGAASSSISITSDASGTLAPLILSGTGVTAPGAPTISIASPASGSILSGTVTVTSSVSAPAGVASVQYKLDGANLGVAALNSSYTFSWDTTKTSNGSHTLTAVLTDGGGQQATSAPVTISVNNSGGTTPPSVSIAAPTSGSTVSGTVTVTASASSSRGIASVQIQVDGANTGALLTSAPYNYSWNTTAYVNGSHALNAIAKDTAGNTTKSATVTVTVNNISAPPPNQPAVSITSPLAGTTVSGTITITATATDSKGIADVQFEVDGSNLGGPDSSAPYSQSWSTTGVADGPHTVTAIATSSDSTQQPGSASAVVIVNNSGTGSSLSSAAGWHKIPSTALCGGGTEGNAPFTDPDNFPSNLNSAYASYGFGFTSQCYNILEDSNSGAYDTLRHRLILYGGGHQHYWGNDAFSLELSAVSANTPPFMYHLDHSADPVTCPASGPASSTITESNGAICSFNTAGNLTTVLGFPGCTYTPGCTPTQHLTPASVHTYNTTVYIPGSDEMTVFGGATAPLGNASQNAWLLSMSSVIPSCAPNTTTNQQGCNPVWTPIGNPASNNAYINPTGVGAAAAYDANTSGVWIKNQANLQWFNPANNTLSLEANSSIGYHSTAVLDPVDKYMILIGPQSTSPKEGILYVNIACANPPSCTGSDFTLNQPSTVGCANLTGGNNSSPQYMGAQWDPIGQRVVVYPNGGNAIWYINPKTWTCTNETYGATQGTDYPQNTPTASGDEGTFGHFQYDPTYDVFVLCNDPFNDCWYLRLNRSSSTGGGTSGPSVSVTSPSNGATISGTVTITATASDSAGITGVQFQLDGANIGNVLTTAPYSFAWNTTGTSNGIHSLRATAQDAAGKTATSAAVAVTVNNAVSPPPPTVSITSPTSGATVSGTITVSASASSSVGIANVQFLLDGANLGSPQTASPYTVSWSTATVNNGSHTLAAVATDNSGNSATSSSVNVVVSQAAPPPPPPVGDDINISDVSGLGQTNRPVSVPRAFVQGEIANFAQASIGGTPLLTQCDVKNRWPDGSLKFAIVSFVIPTIPANGSVAVSFSNQTSGNNTGFLAPSDMLNSVYNFDGQIQLTGTASHNISARAILNAAGSCSDPGSDPDGGQFECRYWLKGPIVTAVILEDRLNRTFDVNTDSGAGNPLHPIFEAWFYPQNNAVQLGYTLENAWASTTAANSARDQAYNLTITGGNTNPITELPATGTMSQFTRTRWHKTFWLNQPDLTTLLTINYNWPYLALTHVFPPWDTALVLAPERITYEANQFFGPSTNRTLVPTDFGIGFFPGKNGCGGGGCATSGGGGMAQPGANEYHGPLPTWDILYLISQDPRLFKMVVTSADLAGLIPYWFREADSSAGKGQFFDKPTTGSIGTQGRFVSINARENIGLTDVTAITGCNAGTFAADEINYGGSGQDLGIWTTGYNGGDALSTSHKPVVSYTAYYMTGQYAFYEEQMMDSAYSVGMGPGSRGCQTGQRQGAAGYASYDEERLQDWQVRDIALGASAAVDGSPEAAYLLDKLRVNLAMWEGEHSIPLDIPGTGTAVTYSAAWTRGNTTLGGLPFPGNPLGSWSTGICALATLPNCYAAQAPLNTAGLNEPQSANSNFQNDYSAFVIGWINDLGFCPGSCALLNFVSNFFINSAENPAANIFALGDYVYPTTDNGNRPLTSWTTAEQMYATKSSSYSCSGSQASGLVGTSWGMDEFYAGEAMGAMAFMTGITTSQGYSGASAYNAVRSAIAAGSAGKGCINNGLNNGTDFASGSPKWDLAPRK